MLGSQVIFLAYRQANVKKNKKFFLKIILDSGDILAYNKYMGKVCGGVLAPTTRPFIVTHETVSDETISDIPTVSHIWPIVSIGIYTY